MPSLPSVITAGEINSLLYGKLTSCLFVDICIVRVPLQEVKFVFLDDNFSSIRADRAEKKIMLLGAQIYFKA